MLTLYSWKLKIRFENVKKLTLEQQKKATNLYLTAFKLYSFWKFKYFLILANTMTCKNPSEGMQKCVCKMSCLTDLKIESHFKCVGINPHIKESEDESLKKFYC